MSATAAKKQKPLKRHPSKLKKMSAYAILTTSYCFFMVSTFLTVLKFRRLCYIFHCIKYITFQERCQEPSYKKVYKNMPYLLAMIRHLRKFNL